MAYAPLYRSPSQYAMTPIKGQFMAYYVHRPIPPHELDRPMVIRSQRYVNRPGNLALDLYGNEDFWWIFGVRNGFEDPTFDMKLGRLLFIPHPTYVQQLFGS